MATNADIDEFLAKPVDFQDLRMRIRTGERIQSLYAELSDSAMAMEFHCTHDPPDRNMAARSDPGFDV